MTRNPARHFSLVGLFTCITLGLTAFGVIGCGENQNSTPGKPSTAAVDSARDALQQKSKNKNTSPVQNLGVKERRTLKSAGELEK